MATSFKTADTIKVGDVLTTHGEVTAIEIESDGHIGFTTNGGEHDTFARFVIFFHETAEVSIERPEVLSFTVLGNLGGPNANEFEVHRTGCRDIKRKLNRSVTGNDWICEGVDVIAAVQSEIDDFQSQDQGWDWEHFDIVACCH